MHQSSILAIILIWSTGCGSFSVWTRSYILEVGAQSILYVQQLSVYSMA